MQAIYEPKGKAKEYAELACNLYRGCVHGCTYCYAPSILRMKREEFHGEVKPRDGILKALRKDAEKMAGDPRPVLLCFTTDPYQPIEEEKQLTRQAIEILGSNDMKIKVLTKSALAARDFDLFQKYDVDFGMSVIFASDGTGKRFEPEASPFTAREETLRDAHAMAIRTWVSIEPVIYPEHAYQVVERLEGYVDLWKIGKLNYDKVRESGINWPEFLDVMLDVLNSLNAKYYIKDDLWALRSREMRYPKESR